MGCASSKLDDLPAVALCRERCSFLDEAIHQRYALAEAHIGYIHSLRGIGESLSNFIEHEAGNSSGSLPSPTLNLPPVRKGDQVAAKSSPYHSRSNSGSHLHFHSDSDDGSVGSLHHSDHSSPLHLHDGGGLGHMDYMDGGEGMNPYPQEGYMHMNYMRNKATPSVVYQQKPMSPENVYHMGESSNSSYYPYPYQDAGGSGSGSANTYPYSGYSNYGGGNSVGYYGNSAPPPPYGASSQPVPQSKPPPPPPSPPRASAWDFINPFESIERYYSAYTPSRDSKEVREEEGIPDLEDEEFNHYRPQEVVKEVHHKEGKKQQQQQHHSKAVQEDEVAEAQSSLYQTRPSVENEGGVEYEVHVVDKKVVDEEDKRDDHRSGGGAAAAAAAPFKSGSRDAFDVAREIQAQFQRASESGNEIARMLEVGKHPYNRKFGG